MRVLALMCHPDDMEVNCGGTLLKYKKLGHDVVVCHASNGNMGHMQIAPKDLIKVRQDEALEAGRIGGFEVINGGIDDLYMNSADLSQVNRIVEIIRYANPDFIITHPPEDYCSDHRELSELVFRASFSATVPHYEEQLGKAAKLTPLYYCDTSASINFVPTEYVDTSDEIEKWEAMLKCHKSQLKWIMDHNHIDLLETYRARARGRGIECNVTYAEGFRPLLAAQRIATKRYLP